MAAWASLREERVIGRSSEGLSQKRHDGDGVPQHGASPEPKTTASSVLQSIGKSHVMTARRSSQRNSRPQPRLSPYGLITMVPKSHGAASWATLRPEAPPPGHPCLRLTIGPRFPMVPCRADHWDATSTTCLFMAATETHAQQPLSKMPGIGDDKSRPVGAD